jgi:hypothetical protein
MRLVPDGVHRERQGDMRPAEWYVVWLGVPHAEGSVVLGRSRRLRRHQWHRFFPASGAWPKEVKGWVNGAEWLLEVHRAGTPIPPA